MSPRLCSPILPTEANHPRLPGGSNRGGTQEETHALSHLYPRTFGPVLARAVVLDLFSRLVVGWAMAAHRDAKLVEHALQMALARRHPEAGLLHHSDRGSQYTSGSYQKVIAQMGIQVSMSGKGDCYDNAAMESFFSSRVWRVDRLTHLSDSSGGADVDL